MTTRKSKETSPLPPPHFFITLPEKLREYEKKEFNSEFSKLDHKELYCYQLREIDRIKSEGSVTLVQILSTDPRNFFSFFLSF